MPQIIQENFPIPEHLHARITDLLTSAMAQDGADKCSFQVYAEEEGTLFLVGVHGFAESFVKFFYTVKPFDNTSCGRAIRVGSAVIVCDVEHDIEFMPFRTVAKASGYLSVKSIPIYNTDRKKVGVISTHFRNPKYNWDLRTLEHLMKDFAETLNAILSYFPKPIY